MADIKLKLKIIGMHCTSCAMSIDGDLEDSEGIIESKTNYVRQETEVKFDESKISFDKIIKIVKQTGYDAVSVSNN
jgi:copper chaperone CopZ